ncbi:hypothetical protein OHV05_37010 (plasmid) [Kitasatospora sp. NBC_00070]|uniref:hypothetical protein n=1 Tax=Kitasatospora sp. NBC_00070 TaxID=2975962 RepID=UPI003246D6CA
MTISQLHEQANHPEAPTSVSTETRFSPWRRTPTATSSGGPRKRRGWPTSSTAPRAVRPDGSYHTLAAGNVTARQAARHLADRLSTEHRLGHVVYRNGARVSVRVWAKAATLAKSGVAYNAGTLNKGREAGVQMVEVFDGANCGWTSHADLDKATRSLRTVDEAAEWPVSHPRCRRTFGLRPDVLLEELA